MKYIPFCSLNTFSSLSSSFDQGWFSSAEFFLLLCPHHLTKADSVATNWKKKFEKKNQTYESVFRVHSKGSVSLFLPSHLSAGDPLTTNVTIFTPFKGEQRNVIIFFLLFPFPSMLIERVRETENERKGDHHYFNGRRMVSNRNRIFCNIHSSFHFIKDQWRREETWASFHLFLLFLPHSLPLSFSCLFFLNSNSLVQWFRGPEFGDKEYAE